MWCSLGAGHDGIDNTCSFDEQYIMAAYSIQLRESNFLNAFTFSPCSISEFRVFLQRLATSARSVQPHNQPDQALPGQRINHLSPTVIIIITKIYIAHYRITPNALIVSVRSSE